MLMYKYKFIYTQQQFILFLPITDNWHQNNFQEYIWSVNFWGINLTETGLLLTKVCLQLHMHVHASLVNETWLSFLHRAINLSPTCFCKADVWRGVSGVKVCINLWLMSSVGTDRSDLLNDAAPAPLFCWLIGWQTHTSQACPWMIMSCQQNWDNEVTGICKGGVSELDMWMDVCKDVCEFGGKRHGSHIKKKLKNWIVCILTYKHKVGKKHSQQTANSWTVISLQHLMGS